MVRYRIDQIKLGLDELENSFESKIRRNLSKSQRNLPREFKIENIAAIKKSIDGRDRFKEGVKWVYSLAFDSDAKLDLPIYEEFKYQIPKVEPEALRVDEVKKNQVAQVSSLSGEESPAYDAAAKEAMAKPIVVGFGPCGIFAALVLAEAGLKPIVLERGEDVDARTRAVEEFWKTGKLNPESNVQFGEGGAGTFSDGKLNTGIKDSRIRFVLETLVEAGADPEILIDARPHVGTDVLKIVVKNIRERIISLGGEVRFGAKVEELVLGASSDGVGAQSGDAGSDATDAASGGESSDDVNGRASEDKAFTGGGRKLEDENEKVGSEAQALHIKGVKLSNGETILSNQVVLALGHSARDTVRKLYSQNLAMESKPFSMGVRVEHPQELIDRGMYGKDAGHPSLPPAYYKLSYKAKDGRGVYSFCMCPGGEIVNASSQEGGVCTNGMSNHRRDSGKANSGILVDIRPEDCRLDIEETSGSEASHGMAFNESDPLVGMYFQEKYEHLAFLNGGGTYQLPETIWKEFSRAVRNNRVNEEVAGLEKSADISDPVVDSLPRFVAEDIAEGMEFFNRRIEGFGRDDVRIVGIEARSSSPVRILRDKKSLQAMTISISSLLDGTGEEWNISGKIITGLYPGGEGAGYAGGITSAAVDGIKIAEKIIESCVDSRFFG